MRKSTARVTPLRASKPTPEAQPLGPGLHAGTIECAIGQRWRVRMLDGRKLDVELGPAVQPALLHQCAADGRLVILSDLGLGPVVLGALQTAPQVAPDAEGHLDIRVERLTLEGTKEVTLRTPKSSIELRADGKAKLRSRRLTLDVPDNVRVRSALVELP